MGSQFGTWKMWSGSPFWRHGKPRWIFTGCSKKKDGTQNCHQIEGNITWLTLINCNEAVDLGVPHSQTSPTCGSCPRPQAIPVDSPFAKVGNLKDVVREPGSRLGFTIRPAMAIQVDITLIRLGGISPKMSWFQIGEWSSGWWWLGQTFYDFPILSHH